MHGKGQLRSVLFFVNGIDNNKNIGPLLDYIYPVGSIYMSINPSDPSTLFGGVWVKLQEGVVVLSAGDTYTAGSTGGEASHAITEAEMPSHTHTQVEHSHDRGSMEIRGSIGACTGAWDYTGGATGAFYKGSIKYEIGSGGSPIAKYSVYMEASKDWSGTTNSVAPAINATGQSQPMSLIQPYFSAYIWYRTA